MSHERNDLFCLQFSESFKIGVQLYNKDSWTETNNARWSYVHDGNYFNNINNLFRSDREH